MKLRIRRRASRRARPRRRGQSTERSPPAAAGVRVRGDSSAHRHPASPRRSPWSATTPSPPRSACSRSSRRRPATRSRCCAAATRARPSTRRSSPRTTRRATSSSASTTPCSPARSTTACSPRTRPRAWTRSAPHVQLDAAPAPGHADRLRRRLRQLRPGVLHRAQAGARRPPSPTWSSPQYKNLLVTENAATSSPGPGFLLGSAAAYRRRRAGRRYWKQLKDNGVEVVDGWEQAYNDELLRLRRRQEGQGRPAAGRLLRLQPARRGRLRRPAARRSRRSASPPAPASGRSSSPGCCTARRTPRAARRCIDFMLSKTFQQDMPLQMFVDPVRDGRHASPPVFVEVRRRRSTTRRPWPPTRSPTSATSGSSHGRRSS